MYVVVAMSRQRFRQTHLRHITVVNKIPDHSDRKHISGIAKAVTADVQAIDGLFAHCHKVMLLWSELSSFATHGDTGHPRRTPSSVAPAL